MWLNRPSDSAIVAQSSGLLVQYRCIVDVQAHEGDAYPFVRVIYDLSPRVMPGMQKFMSDPRTKAKKYLFYDEGYENIARAAAAAAGIRAAAGI